MPNITDLEPLLTAPAEALDVEYKGWLDLRGNDEHKGLLAKATIAIANEGGGNIVVGIRENRPNLISEPRPPEIAAYDQDLINQIIRRFASPAFHCTLTVLRHPETGHEHAVVGVPGGFGFPVISKSGTAQNTIRPHLVYMRKPGPESAPPENQADWEKLLGRCLRNRREDMLDAIRTIVEGKATPAAPPEPNQVQGQTAFADGARTRWHQLTGALEVEAPERCPLGRYEFDYALLGDFARPNLADLLGMLERAVVRHTGWPEFWVPNRDVYRPVPYDDGIDCWLGARAPQQIGAREPAQADFWRASPEGRMFLLRGYAEDSPSFLAGRFGVGSIFDITGPIWRVGECLLHADNLARLLAPPEVGLRILFRARWYGLAERRLGSLDPMRAFFLGEGYVARQNDFAADVTVDSARIHDSLPEVVHSLLVPLYERFSFFRLPFDLVAENLMRMRGNRL